MALGDAKKLLGDLGVDDLLVSSCQLLRQLKLLMERGSNPCQTLDSSVRDLGAIKPQVFQVGQMLGYEVAGKHEMIP